MLEKILRTGRTKILEKPEQGSFIIGHIAGAGARIAVVIARDGENRSVVVLVRLVELHRVIPADAVEINHVSQVEKKERLLPKRVTGSAIGDLLGHERGQAILGFRAVDSAAVTYGVKDHRFGRGDSPIHARQDNVEGNTQVDVVRGRRRNKGGAVRRRRDWLVERPLGFAEGERCHKER